MPEKVIITAAITGSAPTKEMSPAVPYSPAEIANSAIECWQAGAAIAHIHVREPETGLASSEIELFREVVERIRDHCDILINLTTTGFHLEGNPDDLFDIRLAPVLLKPEICSLDIGTLNFRGGVFVNPPEWGLIAAKRMREHKVKPEIEVFDTGHISQAIDMLKGELFDDPPYFQLCMGVKWGIEATVENLLLMKSKFPKNAKWSVLGVGKSQLTMITTGILLGGNIRVGLEDNLYFRKGVLAKSNAQFVENAAKLVHQLQREIASPSEAKDILGLTP
ncbi:MAG: 3-keto-5-aminohexanoate cleavage protein [Anaerolineales bacterium]|nr:3-keto-5-aminohexanoate cleavage protein [Chloroflexota bacterium]MBL6982186.1 3-keto-5-aminohexanoate cleavage protein [Anaerolineales bacterium]